MGELGIASNAICCSNPDCLKVTVVAWIAEQVINYRGIKVTGDSSSAIFVKQLIPDSSAKPQPDYIPAPLVEDYVEACRIVDLSPKASATLARRCLQGMIRDFCELSDATLYMEISALRDLVAEGNAPHSVSPESVEAIDHVRGIGNIGAHMERDINVIIPVEADEAKLLIELIESLFEEWYGARQRRRERFSSIEKLAEEKRRLLEGAEEEQLSLPDQSQNPGKSKKT